MTVVDAARVQLRQAWRSFAARPGLAVTLVATLAIGVGANTLLFAIVEAAILRPFPFPDPDRFVGIGAAYPRLRAPLGFFEVFSGPEYVDLRDGLRDVARVSGFDLGNEPVLIGDSPERVFTAYLFDDLLGTLALPPAAGRGFTTEDLAGAAPVAMISHRFWIDRFGGTPAVGRVIRIGDRAHEIIGILPPRTRLYGTDLWIPMREAAARLPRSRRQFNVVARLAPTASLDDVSRRLDATARSLDTQFAASVPEYAGVAFAARRWADIEVWGGAPVTSLTFAGAGLLLLLIAGNLTNIHFAGAAARQREMAVRLALGARRRQIAGQVIAETLLLAGTGALVGCGLAALGLQGLRTLLPGFLPSDLEVTLTATSVLFAMAVATLAAVLIAAGPAWHLARLRPGTLASASGRLVGSASTRRVQFAVVGAAAAIAVIVTGTAAMLALQTWRLLAVDPGFDTARLVVMRLTLPLPKYEGSASLQFFDQLVERAAALPSVAAVSLSNQPPPGVFSRAQFEIAGASAAPDGSLPAAFYTNAGARYRDTLGLRLTRGRWFDERADRGGPREVVINQAAADRFFPDGDPVGRRIRLQGAVSDGAWAEIVGVVADVRNRGLVPPPAPEIIGSVRQIPDRRQSQLYLVARARTDTAAVVRDVRRIVTALDPAQPIYGVADTAAQFAAGMAPRLAAGRVLTAFTVIALAIAALGIHGVLAHVARQRRREIGLRLALGAPPTSVRRLIARQALVPAGVGIAAGLGFVIAGQQLVATWVYGVSPEPIALGMAASLLVAVALVAAARPAWHASRLDPADVLKVE